MIKEKYLVVASKKYDALQALNNFIHMDYRDEKQFEKLMKNTGRPRPCGTEPAQYKLFVISFDYANT